jgi:hypothetical protein
MSFPSTLEELKANGYKHLGEGRCRYCGEDIEWWETPRLKRIPMNHGTAVAHWKECTEAEPQRNPEPSLSSQTITWLRNQARSCDCIVCETLRGLVL